MRLARAVDVTMAEVVSEAPWRAMEVVCESGITIPVTGFYLLAKDDGGVLPCSIQCSIHTGGMMSLNHPVYYICLPRVCGNSLAVVQNV